MFKKYDAMDTLVKQNVQGGAGSPHFRYLFSTEEAGGRAELMAEVTLQPGESIGVHPHTENGEAYVILAGSATMHEDGVERVVTVGDAEFCADGHTHGIRNHTDQPMRVLAVIFPNR